MLQRLPDELLVRVAKYVYAGDHYDRNSRSRGVYNSQGRLIAGLPKSSPVERNWGYGFKSLLDLSAIDRRTRAVVLELLVPNISVQVCNIPSLILMYLQYPDLARKTKVLNIKRSKLTSRNFSCDDELPPWRPRLFGDDFFKACESVIWSDPTTNLYDKRMWHHDLRHGNMDAAFGVLFVLLPNLEKMHLQSIALSELTFFNFLFEPTSAPHDEWETPIYCVCEYLEKTFAAHLVRLQELEMPRRWDAHSYLRFETVANTLYTGEQIPAGSLLCCESLRRFVAPEAAFFHSYQAIEDNPELSTFTDPCAILPQTLESLTIFDIDFFSAFKNQKHRVLEFLDTLFDEMRRSREQRRSTPHCPDLQPCAIPELFPALHYIYIEYEQTCAFYDHLYTLMDWAVVESTQDKLQDIGKGLGVELEFSFPWVGDPFYP